MSDPRIVNIRDLGKVGTWPKDVRRIDRRTPYGNPFPIADMMWSAVALYGLNCEGNRRLASIAFYRAWINDVPSVSVPEALPGDERQGSIEYSSGRVATVASVTRRFATFGAQMDLAKLELPKRPSLEPLRGFRLACWCAPLPCHGEVILEWLDSHAAPDPEQLPVCANCGEAIAWNQLEDRGGRPIHRVCPRRRRRVFAGNGR